MPRSRYSRQSRGPAPWRRQRCRSSRSRRSLRAPWSHRSPRSRTTHPHLRRGSRRANAPARCCDSSGSRMYSATPAPRLRDRQRQWLQRPVAACLRTMCRSYLPCPLTTTWPRLPRCPLRWCTLSLCRSANRSRTSSGRVRDNRPRWDILASDPYLTLPSAPPRNRAGPTRSPVRLRCACVSHCRADCSSCRAAPAWRRALAQHSS